MSMDETRANYKAFALCYGWNLARGFRRGKSAGLRDDRFSSKREISYASL